MLRFYSAEPDESSKINYKLFSCIICHNIAYDPCGCLKCTAIICSPCKVEWKRSKNGYFKCP